jgi:hypothetical protein
MEQESASYMKGSTIMMSIMIWAIQITVKNLLALFLEGLAHIPILVGEGQVDIRQGKVSSIVEFL